MCSSVSLSLLFIPSNVFFISGIEYFISDWVFVMFPSSLLKFSLCSFILFSNSVNVFIANALNSVSDKLFVCLFSRDLLLLFPLRAVPLPFHFA